MNLKQRISLLAASILPVLALSAYFLMAPVKTSAQSCPGGQFKAGPCKAGGGCESGTGTCYSIGAHGIFIFCPGGPGICETGSIVCCTQ